MAVSTYPPLRSSTIHHKFRSIKTHAIRNVSSARVSVPSIVVQNPSPQPGEFPWKWRTSLHATAPYWTSAYCDICLFRLVFAQLCVSGWFTGLSGKFLSARTARLLALAGGGTVGQGADDRADAGKVPTCGVGRCRAYRARGKYSSPPHKCRRTDPIFRTIQNIWPTSSLSSGGGTNG